ncbi:hypothetical protein Hdeb2414_s0004g00139391 [Helianthus debilis subsp. tardiflorus]
MGLYFGCGSKTVNSWSTVGILGFGSTVVRVCFDSSYVWFGPSWSIEGSVQFRVSIRLGQLVNGQIWCLANFSQQTVNGQLSGQQAVNTRPGKV